MTSPQLQSHSFSISLSQPLCHACLFLKLLSDRWEQTILALVENTGRREAPGGRKEEGAFSSISLSLTMSPAFLREE